jgi:hypothetical protein
MKYLAVLALGSVGIYVVLGFQLAYNEPVLSLLIAGAVISAVLMSQEGS